MTTWKTNESVGFLGLGQLGSPIATNLLAAGVKLTVWNRTASKAEPLVQKGATLARTPGEAIPRGGVVFTLLWDDASLRELMAREDFLSALGPGGVHVSMTTVTPETSREVAARHASHGSGFVEAPIFGVPAQAVARELIVCLAGARAEKERVRPLLEAMGAQRVVDFGEDIGPATATKLVGNFLLISSFVALREAFGVLRQNGIDPVPTLEMLRSTPLLSVPVSRYAGYLTSGQPVPNTGIPLKDVGLFERFAQGAQGHAPLAKVMRELLEANEDPSSTEAPRAPQGRR